MVWRANQPKFRGKKNKNLGSHFDIAKSLLNQMDIESMSSVIVEIYSQKQKKIVPFVFPRDMQ